MVGMNMTKRLVFFLFLQFLLLLRFSTSSLTSLSQNQSLRAKQTLISSNGSFELGFFSCGTNSYLGIRYGKVLAKTIVWVANTDTPLLDSSSSSLSFTHQGDLALFNANKTVIWSSKNGNISYSRNPVAQLTETGNLVIQNEAGEFIWQSFDYLSNTLLPEMKIGKNFITGRETFLTSWKKNEDPSRGRFELRMDVRGFPQLILWNRSMPYYRLGSWNGERFTGTPELSKSNQICDYEFKMNSNEVYYKCVSSSNIISRLVVNETGLVQRYATTYENSANWLQIYEAPRDPCDYYNVCGAHATCKIGSSSYSNATSCECLKGFVAKFQREWGQSNWSGGCKRETPVDCSKKDSEFLVYPGLKLPDTSSSGFNTSMSLEECQEMCNGNCSCVAYATSDIIKGIGCLLWFDQLVDMRSFDKGGQDIYIRIAIPKQDDMSKTAKGGIISSVIVLVLGGLVILALIAYVRNNKNAGEKDEMDLPLFGLATIVKATDNFSINNKLGQGGFGPVYKGTLIDGQEIAVKKLSKSSGQGATEFKNEVSLIAKLQHRNLVKLLGCCVEGDEKLLIYEYMPNKSLDFFIFGETRCKFLDWSKQLQIIEGIARGLLYLHQDSRCRIIHRDLKASNVLLDKDMNPKISDFGMARMVGVDDTEGEAYTNRVVGTFGYMSPEYVVNGLFSVKSDVFSYGVLVLEIISGMKNQGFSNPQHGHNLVGHAWKLWMEERSLELTDTTTQGDSSVLSGRVLRCIHIALLCLQQRPEDRPSMSVVVQMLGSDDTTSLPHPKQPGFFTERNIHHQPTITTSTSLLYSQNGCSSITTLAGR